MRKRIEISSDIDLDSLRYSLQNSLTTKGLALFAFTLGSNLTDAETFYKLLQKATNQLVERMEQ